MRFEFVSLCTTEHRSEYILARLRKTLPGVLIKMEAPNFHFVRRILSKEPDKKNYQILQGSEEGLRQCLKWPIWEKKQKRKTEIFIHKWHWLAIYWISRFMGLLYEQSRISFDNFYDANPKITYSSSYLQSL